MMLDTAWELHWVPNRYQFLSFHMKKLILPSKFLSYPVKVTEFFKLLRPWVYGPRGFLKLYQMILTPEIPVQNLIGQRRRMLGVDSIHNEFKIRRS